MGIAVEVQKDKRVYRRTRRGEMRPKKRASWAELGVSRERLRELKEIAKEDRFADIVVEAALRADRLVAGHIVLAVTKNLSYELIEFNERLGRCPVGKTDFYGYRRLFFYYLDEILKGQEGQHG